MAANMAESTGTSSRGTRAKDGDDFLQLQSSDHLGMVLVTTPLNGRNFLAWSRAVKIALGAKLKLGFITGECKKPAADSGHYRQWIRVDCMVEKQRQVNMGLSELEEDMALFTRGLEQRIDNQNRGIFKKRGIVDERNMKCEHCDRPGLDKSTCFKLHGVLDWYKELNEQKKKNANGVRAFLAQTSRDKQIHKDAKIDGTASSSEVVMEVMRLMKSKVPADPIQVNYAQTDEYAGPDDE
ncbi:UNVERIFIED_CONTAM: hypothetical protein Sradi_3334600 [Sesamum radiatum]|uniref:Retrotransposon Copia-like N-terminal domain-containing protein n=1 Tax=Sesamum radiatum TaxID=300843 RepID=A0AAW2R2U5_SESRA